MMGDDAGMAAPPPGSVTAGQRRREARPFRRGLLGSSPAREQSAAANVYGGEAFTMKFRVQFLDVSSAVIKEMHIEAHSVAAPIELVAGLDWPIGAVRMVILDEVGSAVHSEWK
jgi:hypothetical protein